MVLCDSDRVDLGAGDPTDHQGSVFLRSWDTEMTKRQEVLDYGLTFPGAYVDTPFHDPNWTLLRYRENRRSFAFVYERNSLIWVNVKVDPQWRDMWRQVYPSVVPAYHQNKEHWNSIILDGSVPDEEIKRMIADSYAGLLK